METTNFKKFSGPEEDMMYNDSRSCENRFVSCYVLRDPVLCEEDSSEGTDSHSGEHHHHHHHHHSSHKKRKRSSFKDWMKNNKSNIIKALGVVVALGVIAVLLVLINSVNRDGDDPVQEHEGYSDEGAIIKYENEFYQERTDLDVILLMGIDKTLKDVDTDPDQYLNTQQTDFNLILIIDHKAKTIQTLQLNRDTMTQVKKYGLNAIYQGTEIMQLALAHTYGTGGKDSCRYTVDAVETLLYNITIDHYIAVTMDAVMVLNDEVGGVTVLVEDDFTGVNDRFVKGKEVTLFGEEALQFVRARSSMVEDKTNLARMRRQRTYLESLQGLVLNKVASSDTWSLKTISKMADYMTSDMSYQEMADFLDNLKDYTTNSILTTEGEAVTKEYVEFNVDEKALRQQVIDLFYVKYTGDEK